MDMQVKNDAGVKVTGGGTEREIAGIGSDSTVNKKKMKLQKDILKKMVKERTKMI